MGTFIAFVAFTRTKVNPPQDGMHYRDTVPYRHYDPNRTYVDVYTGDTIDLWYDPSNRVTTNKRNKRRVDFYVDPITYDTFYGEGFVVNNLIVKMPNGKYRLDSTKVKIEGNKIKYKDGSDSADLYPPSGQTRRCRSCGWIRGRCFRARFFDTRCQILEGRC